MTRQIKVRDLFIELINTQLEPHNVTYEDVIGNSQWYMEYKTTPEKEKEFINHCISRIQEELDLDYKMAEKEAHWFILQWGLTLEKGSITNHEKILNKKKAK